MLGLFSHERIRAMRGTLKTADPASLSARILQGIYNDDQTCEKMDNVVCHIQEVLSDASNKASGPDAELDLFDRLFDLCLQGNDKKLVVAVADVAEALCRMRTPDPEE